MPVLPVPMITSLLLLGFLIHRVIMRETPPVLLALIACCAAQTALIAAVQYYGLTGLRVFQPLGATVIPAVAWLAFRQATAGQIRYKDLCLHSAGPVVALICLAIYPNALDLVIPVLFAAYGIAIAATLFQGEDSLPHSRLENGNQSLLVWCVLAAALIGSAATDVFIAIRLSSGNNDALLWVPSLLSSVTLLALGALSVSHSIESQTTNTLSQAVEYSVQDEKRDHTIIAKLDTYIETNRPYLDPDLTLTRLARKLLIPEKQLSGAINKLKGENVSRYINLHRVQHAAAMLQDGKSVTEAMFASGFNTKSNFNREFLRVYKANPRLWLKTRAEPLK